MTDVADAKKLLQQEETDYRSAVSEALLQKMAGIVNFHANRQYDVRLFEFYGPYSRFTPQNFAAGPIVFPIKVEVFNVILYILDSGSSGKTEFDVKRQTTKGGSFGSIFQTKPSIQASAGDYYWIGKGESDPDATAPVFLSAADTVTLDAGTAIVIDITEAQANAINASLGVYFRPTT